MATRFVSRSLRRRLLCAFGSIGMLSVGGLAQAAEFSPEQQAAWRQQIRAAWHVPEPLPALALEAHGTFSPEPGVVVERVSYATQLGMRVPALVYRPERPRGKAPALIVVNGHGGDKYSWYAFYSGILYARAGAVVLTYDPAGEGERNAARKSGTRAHDKVESPETLGPWLGGLMMTDILQAVSYLAGRSDVDASRIGAMGYSMGSFILAITGAVETRLKACVLVGGGNLDGPDGYWDTSKPMCQGAPYRALGFLGDRPAAIYALHAARGPTLLCNGLEDTTVSIPQMGEGHFRAMRARAVALRGADAGIFEAEFVPGAAHRPYFVTRLVARWLERQLDFLAWTPAEIERMPATHIADWARKENVPMDALYATEQREGGTPALGTGVPGIAREQLHALPPAEWERRKEQFVHEAWLRAARAAAASRN